MSLESFLNPARKRIPKGPVRAIISHRVLIQETIRKARVITEEKLYQRLTNRIHTLRKAGGLVAYLSKDKLHKQLQALLYKGAITKQGTSYYPD